MQRDAEIGSALDQLAVLHPNSRQACLVPLDQSSFARDPQISTRSRNRVVNARLTTADDHQVRTVSGKQPAYNLICQFLTVPMSVSNE
jgi:hypothetical protein